MTMRALVKDGKVVEVGAVPHTWRLADGRWVSGFDWREDLWEQEGWLPVVEQQPDVPDGHTLGHPVDRVEDGKVVRTWNLVDEEQEEDVLQVLQRRVDALERTVSRLAKEIGSIASDIEYIHDEVER